MAICWIASEQSVKAGYQAAGYQRYPTFSAVEAGKGGNETGRPARIGSKTTPGGPDAVASPRGGGKLGNLPPPPQTPIGHPVRSMQIRGDFRVRKNGGRFTGFAPKFSCTDATADVLWSYDYEKERVVEVVEGVTLVGPRWSCGALWDLSFLALALRSITFVVYFIFILFSNVNLGLIPQNSGPNPMSFQFLTGGRLA